jgi:hypothetical protein
MSPVLWVGLIVAICSVLTLLGGVGVLVFRSGKSAQSLINIDKHLGILNGRMGDGEERLQDHGERLARLEG